MLGLSQGGGEENHSKVQPRASLTVGTLFSQSPCILHGYARGCTSGWSPSATGASNSVHLMGKKGANHKQL